MRRNQKGGIGSDYVHLWHSPSADNAQLSRYSLKYIDQTPMFNPLESGGVWATPTSGVIPTGTYYASIAPLQRNNPVGPPTVQNGGATNFDKYSKERLRGICCKLGIDNTGNASTLKQRIRSFVCNC